MNLLLDIFALRNISKGKAKQNDNNVDKVEQNSNVKVIQQHILCNSREACFI